MNGYGPTHLPYGVVVIDGQRRPAVRVGDHALDLAGAEAAGLLDAYLVRADTAARLAQVEA
jgi:hypothetical protein